MHVSVYKIVVDDIVYYVGDISPVDKYFVDTKFPVVNGLNLGISVARIV